MHIHGFLLSWCVAAGAGSCRLGLIAPGSLERTHREERERKRSADLGQPDDGEGPGVLLLVVVYRFKLIAWCLTWVYAISCAAW